MADLKQILKDTVKKFKRAQVVEPEGSKRMRVAQEAAKQAAKEIKAERE